MKVMAILQLDAERGVGKVLQHLALHLDDIVESFEVFNQFISIK